MSKDLRRKKKKIKKAARTAQRRAKGATKALAPQFDPALPTTRAAIEAEMEALIPKMSSETPAGVEHDERGRTLHLSPARAHFLQLQKQLFRAVFRREPGPHDPLFWDPDREHEGAFPIDPEKERRDLAKALTKVEIRPELAYAVALTGMVPVEESAPLYDEEALEQWQQAVDDYVHQAATGVVPLVPEEFLHAWESVNRLAAHENVIPMGIAGHVDTPENRVILILQAELGTYEKAVAAMARMAALVALADHEELKYLASPEGYSESAILAAASAELDRSKRSFDIQSFRDRLDALSE